MWHLHRTLNHDDVIPLSESVRTKSSKPNDSQKHLHHPLDEIHEPLHCDFTQGR